MKVFSKTRAICAALIAEGAAFILAKKIGDFDLKIDKGVGTEKIILSNRIPIYVENKSLCRKSHAFIKEKLNTNLDH